ncbi:hypothetical protein HPB52_000081 [Rhipicephalus sanguineus]|uniref:Nuclease HARBI1 n=1 Tax=Rhipicephalus sanguineus TaxID=34632 RepID=A0A9D4PUE6_RHISA|nr:hypothetical protein HPB52_000081 [Rhipicephalus sanguineus]
MQMVLEAFATQMGTLAETGVEWTCDGDTYNSKVYCFNGTADAPARAMMQNVVQYNGYFGYGWRLHPGKCVERRKEGAAPPPCMTRRVRSGGGPPGSVHGRVLGRLCREEIGGPQAGPPWAAGIPNPRRFAPIVRSTWRRCRVAARFHRSGRLVGRGGYTAALPDEELRAQAWHTGGVVGPGLVGGDPYCRRSRQIPTREKNELAESDDSSSSSGSTCEDSSDEEALEAGVYEHVFDVMFRPPDKKPKVEHFVDDVVRQYSDEEFRRHFRLSRRVATELIAGFASSPMCPTDNHDGKAAKSAETHILSFIWYAANKTCMRDVADRFNLAESTVHRVLQRVADYLCTLGPTVLTFPRDLEKLSRDFEKVSGVPGVVGCIDGCYIRIQCPENKKLRHTSTDTTSSQ